VNVKDAPAQATVALGVIETDGTKRAVTVIGIEFDVAGEPSKQGAALDVI
jgi:hypothetical protein